MPDLDDPSECQSAPECAGSRRGAPRTRIARLAAGLAVVSVTTTLGMPRAGASCLAPPVDAAVIRPFQAAPCEWCAGHRGVSYATVAGTPVRAAAAGEVTFSGVVVDVRYVVVRHDDGLLATYGGLASSALTAGERVAAGATVGTAGPELYFGLRTGPDAYIDPAPLIGELVVRPYLVPTDGSAARPPPPPTLRCA